MLTSERKALIAKKLAGDGRLVAKELAEKLGLSEDTIRRDLREMAAEGLLVRVHGGALPVEPPLPDYETRTQVATEEKRQLAAAAVGLVEPGQIIFIDGGSTNLALVRALPRDLALTVITHSPTIATALEHHQKVQIVLIGGLIYRHSMVAVGAIAMHAISQLRLDLFFLGVTGVHPRYGFTTGDIEEAAIKRHIAGQAKQVWVMATGDKLDVASPVTIMPLEAATGVIVAAGLASETKHFLEDAGLSLIEA